jgi:hypothetical protein
VFFRRFVLRWNDVWKLLEAERLKQLEEENRRLKRMVAGLSLADQMFEDVIAMSR